MNILDYCCCYYSNLKKSASLFNSGIRYCVWIFENESVNEDSCSKINGLYPNDSKICSLGLQNGWLWKQKRVGGNKKKKKRNEKISKKEKKGKISKKKGGSK